MNPIEIDNIQKEANRLYKDEFIVSEHPVRWNSDSYGLFRRIGEAINELRKHPESLQRAEDLKRIALSTLLFRQYKAEYGDCTHQSEMDKIFMKEVEKAFCTCIGVDIFDSPQHLEQKNESPAENHRLEMVSVVGKPEGQSVDVVQKAEPSIEPHQVRGDNYKDVILLRVVWKFKGPEPVAIEMHDPTSPNKVKVYHLRSGDIIHVPAAHAKLFIDRGIAIPVNIEMKGVV